MVAATVVALEGMTAVAVAAPVVVIAAECWNPGWRP